MFNRLMVTAALALLAAPAMAGDPAAGEAIFKKCAACHAITAADGTVVKKGGKLAPNLFGVIGRVMGSQEGFKYSPGFKEANETGTVWDEALLAEYVADPNAFIAKITGDAKAHSAMTFKLPTGGEDIAAYLASVK